MKFYITILLVAILKLSLAPFAKIAFFIGFSKGFIIAKFTVLVGNIKVESTAKMEVIKRMSFLLIKNSRFEGTKKTANLIALILTF